MSMKHIQPDESARVANLRQIVLDAERSVDPERARHFYEHLYKEEGLKNEPLKPANAKAFRNYLRKCTIYIDPGQLEKVVDDISLKSIRSRVYGSLNDEELNIVLKNPGKDIIAAS